MATKKTPATEEQQIAEFQAAIVTAVQAAVADAVSPLMARIVALEAQLAAAPAKLVARQQSTGNPFERAKLAVNKAAGREPHAFVKRDAIDAWMAEHA